VNNITTLGQLNIKWAKVLAECQHDRHKKLIKFRHSNRTVTVYILTLTYSNRAVKEISKHIDLGAQVGIMGILKQSIQAYCQGKIYNRYHEPQ